MHLMATIVYFEEIYKKLKIEEIILSSEITIITFVLTLCASIIFEKLHRGSGGQFNKKDKHPQATRQCYAISNWKSYDREKFENKFEIYSWHFDRTCHLSGKIEDVSCKNIIEINTKTVIWAVLYLLDEG